MSSSSTDLLSLFHTESIRPDEGREALYNLTQASFLQTGSMIEIRPLHYSHKLEIKY